MCTANVKRTSTGSPEADAAQEKLANTSPLSIMFGKQFADSANGNPVAAKMNEGWRKFIGTPSTSAGKPTALPTDGASGSGPDIRADRFGGGRPEKGSGPAAIVAPAAAPPVRIDRTFTAQSAPASSTTPRKRSIRGGKDVTASSAFGRSGLNIPQ